MEDGGKDRREETVVVGPRQESAMIGRTAP
jgi:hypothetical protein